MERGADIFRSKGVLSLAGTDDKYARMPHVADNRLCSRRLLCHWLCDCIQGTFLGKSSWEVAPGKIAVTNVS